MSNTQTNAARRTDRSPWPRLAPDPGWYEAYWLSPEPERPPRTALPGRFGIAGLFGFFLAIIATAIDLSASVGSGPCTTIGE